jgi:hypothetical protein
MNGRCLAHLDPETLELALSGAGNGPGLDARGVRVTAALWERIWDFAFRRDGDDPTPTPLRFDEAMFEPDVSFLALNISRRDTFTGALLTGKLTSLPWDSTAPPSAVRLFWA